MPVLIKPGDTVSPKFALYVTRFKILEWRRGHKTKEETHPRFTDTIATQFQRQKLWNSDQKAV